MLSIILLAVGIGVRWTIRDRGDDPSNPAPQAQSEWDSRVQSHVTFVESHRGLGFVHPVEIEFMAEDDYLDLFEPGDVSPSESYQAAAEQYANLLNAEGLTSGIDQGDTDTRVAQTSSLGFYDFDSQRIFVRGDELTPAVQVVLVHELTHALQAQHFDIELGGDDDLVKRAVVEADAMRIEWEFADTLAGSERDQADVDNSMDDETSAQLDQFPWALVQQTFAPYDLGPNFLAHVERLGGDTAINAVFEHFPTQEELITPALYGSGITDKDVAASAPDGASVLDPARPWPMFDALVMLDAWLPWLEARTPFDGWAGGSIVTYERGGEGGPLCFTAVAAFDDEVVAAAFATAVSHWATSAASPAAPTTAGTEVSFESCDRGDGAALPPKPAFSTSEQVLLEGNLLGAGEEQDPTTSPVPEPSDGTVYVPLTRSDQQCIVRTMIDDPDLGPLFLKDTFTPAEDDILLLRSTIARNTCGIFP